MVTVKRTKLSALRAAAKAFRDTREEVKRLDAGVKEQQPELIDALKEAGVTNEVGIVFDESDKSKGAAYVQQNAGSVVWDHDAIITWLRRKNSRWLACSTRQFDVRKWEAEVAAGNVPKSIVKKMQHTTDPASPFIRFGKITKDSL